MLFAFHNHPEMVGCVEVFLPCLIKSEETELVLDIPGVDDPHIKTVGSAFTCLSRLMNEQ